MEGGTALPGDIPEALHNLLGGLQASLGSLLGFVTISFIAIVQCK